MLQTVLQVQKGAPVDLLLGTDVLCLGFALVCTNKNGLVTDLPSTNSATPLFLEELVAKPKHPNKPHPGNMCA